LTRALGKSDVVATPTNLWGSCAEPKTIPVRVIVYGPAGAPAGPTVMTRNEAGPGCAGVVGLIGGQQATN
jgi:hypothetical protein